LRLPPTQSTSGIATSGVYQTSFAGIADAFLAKFNSSGSLIWSTYYGGDSANYSASIATDTSGNIYITGTTNSTAGIATFGAYKTSFSGSNNIDGYGDAFLAKFNSSGGVFWATYYGGVKNEEAYGVATDKYNNVYITGVTFSTSGIATSGANQTLGDSINGDCFLAKFSTSGSLLWGTYYGGSGIDNSVCVTTDVNNNVYIGGETNSTSGIATASAYQEFYDTSKGWECGLLAKFNSAGRLLWGTYYGEGTGLNGITTNLTGDVYLTGGTLDTSQIATFGAYQTLYSGGSSNAFLAKFSSLGSLIWGSYFSNSYSGGFSIAIAPFNNIYIYGPASASGLATSGAFQTRNINDDNYFLAKFGIPDVYNDAGISSLVSPKGSACSGLMSFQVQLKNYGPDTLTAVKILCSVNDTIRLNYRWTGSLLSGSTATISLGNYDSRPGIDSLKVWTEPIGFTDTVPRNDTAAVIDTVSQSPDALFTYKRVNGTYHFIPAITTYQTYSWSFGDGNISDSTSPFYEYSNNGTYTVSLTVTAKNGCTATYSIADTINLTGTSTITRQMSGLKIFPNPFTNQTTISGNLDENSAVSISIYDITGRVVVEKNVSGERGAGERFEYTFDASQYGSGIYIVKLTMGNEVATREIVRIR